MRKAKYENGNIQIVDLESVEINANEDKARTIRTLGLEDEVIDAIMKKDEASRTKEEKLKILQRQKVELDYKDVFKEYEDFKPYEEYSYEGEIPIGYSVTPYFEDTGDKVVCRRKLVIDKEKVKKEINQLKKELSSTDYIIIKMYEATLMGEEKPYSDEYLSEVVSNRSEQRERINILQGILDS